MKRLIPVFLTLLFMSAPVYADGYQDGLDAGKRGDYKTTLEKWISLAEQVDTKTQFTLGRMYANGQGVTQDYKKAIKWFSLSAKQGHAESQNTLGWMYANGQGVKQNSKTGVCDGTIQLGN